MLLIFNVFVIKEVHLYFTKMTAKYLIVANQNGFFTTLLQLVPHEMKQICKSGLNKKKP